MSQNEYNVRTFIETEHPEGICVYSTAAIDYLDRRDALVAVMWEDISGHFRHQKYKALVESVGIEAEDTIRILEKTSKKTGLPFEKLHEYSDGNIFLGYTEGCSTLGTAHIMSKQGVGIRPLVDIINGNKEYILLDGTPEGIEKYKKGITPYFKNVKVKDVFPSTHLGINDYIKKFLKRLRIDNDDLLYAMSNLILRKEELLNFRNPKVVDFRKMDSFKEKTETFRKVLTKI